MPESIMAEICEQYRNTHENLLDLIVDLTDEQIGWTPNATTPSIGFHIWRLPSRDDQWTRESIVGKGRTRNPLEYGNRQFRLCPNWYEHG